MLACISRSSSSITSPIGEGEDSSSRGRQNLLSSLGTLLFLLAPPAISLLLPGVASASGGTLSGGALDLFRQFLGGVEGLGPWGPVAFVLVVMLCEMVPLFPTQPLSLASGLLFGAINGALVMLLGVTLAAVNAFLIARGVGRPLAQKVIEWEMKSHEGKEDGSEEGGGEGGMASKMSEVQRTIERGGLWQQITAITLLRLTPVVPFSASNYLLGLTPVQLPAFLGGTVGGMTVWSVLYASLGGASRKLLDNGADIGSLLADLGGKASAMSANIAGYSLVIIGGVAVVYFVKIMVQKKSATSPSSTMPLAGTESIASSNSDNWQKQQQQQQQQSSPQGQSSEAGSKADAPASTAGARGSPQAQAQQQQQQQQLRGTPQANDALQNK